MLKAYKFRLYPNIEQQEFFQKSFGCTRLIYNRMLADKIEHYRNHKEQLNNTPAQYKREFHWLKAMANRSIVFPEAHWL